MATSATYKRYNGRVWEEIIFPYSHTHTFASLASKPTTLSGYGITDAHISNGLITIGSNSIRPITSLSGYAKLTDIPSLSGYATEQWVTNKGYITEITKANVTTALGFTPYNATNPNGYTTNKGTVTSVALTVPTGLSVTGSPITEGGTLAISLASGYSIPTTTKQGNWDAAYGWGDHSKAGYKTTDTNTTYTFANGTNGFTVTPSGGTAQTVTVTPSIVDASTTQKGLMTTTYVTRLNTMWNVWGADSDNSLVNKVEEVLKVFENFPEASNLITLLNGKQDAGDYLTTTNASSTYVTKANAITGLSISGTTITYTKGNGTTGTLTTKDSNTTYSAGTGLSLSTSNAFSVSYGTTAGTACQGNDSRLSDSRNAKDVYSWAKASSKPSYSWSEITSKPTIPTVDTTLSNTSSNAIANKTVFTALQDTETNLNNKLADYQPKGTYITPTTGSEYYPKYIQTRTQPKTGWYGAEYPLYAWWETNNICKLTVDNYSTKVDMATKDASGNVITSTYAKKTDIPTSLPASDVYSWAKASTKPSYIASEVSGLATVATSGKYSDLSGLPNYAASSSAGGAATNVNVTENLPSGMAYLPVLSAKSGSTGVKATPHLYAYSGSGYVYFNVGSSSFTGGLTLHCNNSYYANLATATLSANRDIKIPDKNGTVALTSDIPTVDSTATFSSATSSNVPTKGAVASYVVGNFASKTNLSALDTRVTNLENSSGGSSGGLTNGGSLNTATIGDFYCNYINDASSTSSYVKTSDVISVVDCFSYLGGTSETLEIRYGEFYRVDAAYLYVDGTSIDDYILDVVACLMEGTMITMSDGSSKPIEEVKEGDLLMSYDFETGKKTTTVCLGTRVGDYKNYYYCLLFNNGMRVKTNWTHDIYNATKGTWTNTDQELELDDEVYDESGAKTKFVGRLEAIGTPNGKKVHFYDIMTSNNCYYADGILFAHTPTKQSGWITKHSKDAPTELLDLVASYKNETHRETDLMQKDEYVNKYLDTMHNMFQKESKLRALKDNLSKTDYITLKVSEGIEITDTMQEILDSRKAWRKEFNEVEAELSYVYKTANDLKVKYSDIGEDVLLDSMGLRKKFFLESCKKGNANLNKFKEFYNSLSTKNEEFVKKTNNSTKN